jgi:NAD(P)-dependent dehydrogenase (short-subunit alcohol dehydrogenase family)
MSHRASTDFAGVVPAPLRFENRVAVVTGAGRGLGAAYAVALATRGAAVVVNDLGSSLGGDGTDSEPAAAVTAAIDASGGRAIVNFDDVSTAAGAERMITVALETFGRIDVVINNAGIVNRSTFPDTTLEDMQRHIAVHQIGTFNVSRAAWPHMVRQKYGRVIATISRAIFGIEGVISYSSAKGGVFGLARGLAQVGQAHGIRVNMVAPHAVTRMNGSDGLPTTAIARSRVLTPERVANLVLVLAHERCPATGEMYYAAGDRFSRFFLAETVGYRQADASPEAILEHWTEIGREEGYTVPAARREARFVESQSGSVWRQTTSPNAHSLAQGHPSEVSFETSREHT